MISNLFQIIYLTKNIKEIEDYRQFTTPGELHKTINTLRGIIADISANKFIMKEGIYYAKSIRKKERKELVLPI
jgi:hypothetical protein